MAEDLRGKDGNIMTSIRLSSNMEVLLGVLRELFEEQCEQSIYIFACCDRIANGAAAIRVANVDRLVEEDDRGIRIP